MNIFLKGTLAEATVVVLIGAMYVAAIVGVSYGISTLGIVILLEAATLGIVFGLGLLVGLAPGYVYWARKWKRLVKERRGQ